MPHAAAYPISYDQEDDGRWLAVIEKLPGVMAYGATREESRRAVIALALHVIADRLEHDEPIEPEAPEAVCGLLASVA